MYIRKISKILTDFVLIISYYHECTVFEAVLANIDSQDLIKFKVYQSNESNIRFTIFLDEKMWLYIYDALLYYISKNSFTNNSSNSKTSQKIRENSLQTITNCKKTFFLLSLLTFQKLTRCNWEELATSYGQILIQMVVQLKIN